jgi:hypothetical protein
MLIQRSLQNLVEKYLFKGKVIIIYGARQVGKTTLVKQLLGKYGDEKGYFNCENEVIGEALDSKNPLVLKRVFGENNLIILDEAQNIEDIGLKLKLLVDTYPQLQIIATGSSSFDLANEINEPLTGRSLEFLLFGFSLKELEFMFKKYRTEKLLERFLRFGTYPEVINLEEKEMEVYLNDLANKYLYKDIFKFENLKRPKILTKLVQKLALQVGSEVSINELATGLNVSRETVERYLDLLEKSFVIFSLGSFSRNLRKELDKKRKYYFYDLGVRNSIIKRFVPLEIRDDIGALFENFCILERYKKLQRKQISFNSYFWKTYDQKEIDLVEERKGRLFGYEIKWNDKKKVKAPQGWLKTYSEASFEVINKSNYFDFLI